MQTLLRDPSKEGQEGPGELSPSTAAVGQRREIGEGPCGDSARPGAQPSGASVQHPQLPLPHPQEQRQEQQQSSRSPGSILTLPTAGSLHPGWGSPGHLPGRRPVPALSARSPANAQEGRGNQVRPTGLSGALRCGRNAALRARTGPAHPPAGERVPRGSRHSAPRAGDGRGPRRGRRQLRPLPSAGAPGAGKLPPAAASCPAPPQGGPAVGPEGLGTTATARRGAWPRRARLYRGPEGDGTGRERRCPTKPFPRDQAKPAIGAGRAQAHREWASTAPSRHA